MFTKTLKKRFSTLLVAESSNGILNPGNHNALAAALSLNKPVDILCLGNNLTSESLGLLSHPNVTQVYLANDPTFANTVADAQASAVQNFINSQNKYTHIFAMNSTQTKDYFPRLSATFGSQAITDVTEIVSEDTFKRPVYAGNAIATVKSSSKVNFITVRTTNFEALENGNNVESFEELSASSLLEGRIEGGSRFVSEDIVKSDRPDLGEAKIVVSGGRGLKNGENFKLLEDLADALGEAAIGASRAAVDAGYCANEMQIGQTGKIVAPDLYIAVGISGAIQHLAGMKDSKVIVAINKDSEAPIFQVADYGIVGDLFDVVPELTQKLGQ